MITAPEKVPTKLRANDKLNRLQIISLISLFVLFTLSPFFQKKQNPLQAAKEFWELFNAGKLSHRTLLIAEEFSNWDLDQQPVQDTITISYEAGGVDYQNIKPIDPEEERRIVAELVVQIQELVKVRDFHQLLPFNDIGSGERSHKKATLNRIVGSSSAESAGSIFDLEDMSNLGLAQGRGDSLNALVQSHITSRLSEKGIDLEAGNVRVEGVITPFTQRDIEAFLSMSRYINSYNPKDTSKSVIAVVKQYDHGNLPKDNPNYAVISKYIKNARSVKLILTVNDGQAYKNYQFPMGASFIITWLLWLGMNAYNYNRTLPSRKNGVRRRRS